ncbi:MAG: glycoside hydrolase family protein [Bacteroidota bacterium]
MIRKLPKSAFLNPVILIASLLYTILFTVTACSHQDLSLIPGPIPGNAVVAGDRTVINSPNTLQHPDNFIWGASVIRGEDGKYHMLYASWDTGPENTNFSNAWVLYSEISYAVSAFPDHGFEPVATILRGRMHEGDSTAWDAQAVHNPHVKRFNGKYYLYYIGNRDPGPVEKGEPGWALNKRNRCQQMQSTGVIEFNSFEDLLSGNFTRPDEPLLLPRTRVRNDLDHTLSPSPEGTRTMPDNLIVVNPSVVYRKSDGKYLLYFKGNMYEKGWRGVHGVALGDSPKGPFIALDEFIFDIRNEDGTIASAEDPFVWYHGKHRLFYAIIKDFSGKITGDEPGLAILCSEDGLDWKIPEKGSSSIRKEILFENGEVIQVSNLERPQLLLDRHGNPQVLYAACSVEPVGNKRDGSTFNVHIPLH